MTTYFARIDDTTRRVLETGSGPHFMVPAEIDGTIVLYGASPFDDSGWIDAEGVAHAVPARPSARHVWDWTTKTWALPSTIRADVKALVTAEASRRNAYPFNYGSHYYGCDAQGQAAILGAAALHPTTVPSGWTWLDINGVPVAMDSTEWSLFWAAVADRPLGIQVVVEFLHSFIDDPSHSDAVVAAIEPSTDTYWPETARP